MSYDLRQPGKLQGITCPVQAGQISARTIEP